MDLNIAVLNFNRSRFLDRSLRSCLEQVTINKKIAEDLFKCESTKKAIEKFQKDALML